MQVVKRSKRREDMHFDKITKRIEKLCKGLDKAVMPAVVAQKVVMRIYDGVTTSELDEEAAEICVALQTIHPHFKILAARIVISNMHKNTRQFVKLREYANALYFCQHPKTGEAAPILNKETYDFIMEHADELDAEIDHDRDYTYDYFGYKTLDRSYLKRVNGEVVERPQHLLMRVAVGIWGPDMDMVKKAYKFLSMKWFTHATPTLFNAGTVFPQLASCFLSGIPDSIRGIYGKLTDCAEISQHAGGVGLSASDVRATGSYIAGTNGTSNARYQILIPPWWQILNHRTLAERGNRFTDGARVAPPGSLEECPVRIESLRPMLQVFNFTARYVDQGGGKRKGSIAIYLEPWHADILPWLDLKKNHGNIEERAKDLFYGMWIPNLFMERVDADGDWSLMCPKECPGLTDAFGKAFDELYVKYEQTPGKVRKTIKARVVWQAIKDAQQETGTPYMCYKDWVNLKNNMDNVGTIKNSNLCTEIMEPSGPDEIAVCNLASISLPKCVKYSTATLEDGTVIQSKPYFDHQLLYDVTYFVAQSVDRVIDRTYYPTESARRANMKHRYIGLGPQGLADALIAMNFPFESEEADVLDEEIFETMYFACINASKDLAKLHGPYETYKGSAMSRGLFQFDLWKQTHPELVIKHNGRWDWEALRKEVAIHGVRNALSMAPMPTASTSQILGNTECFEAINSNIYVRRTLAGEFVCTQEVLQHRLIEQGLWTPRMKDRIIAANGSVQKIEEIPQHDRDVFKTVWEMSQKKIIDKAARRGKYIDQSQSLNIHMLEVTDAKLDSMHFHAWRSGLKTGMYYLRTKPATDAIKFTVDPELVKAEKAKNDLFDSIMRVNVNVQKGDASQAVINIQIPVLERQLSAAEVHAARQRQEEENRRKEEEEALLSGSCVGGSCSG